MKLVFNIERVGWSKLEGQRRHDKRIGGDLSHVDLSATGENMVLHGTGDPKADVKACLGKFQAAPRADNEKPFERFVVHPGDGFDWSNSVAIGKWLTDTRQWLQDEYGPGFVYAVVHVDEKKPHIHAVCVPLYKSKTKKREAWKVSHKQHPATKGRGSYERLRRRCADALGFEYGEPGNKPRTEMQRLADEAAEASRVRADAEAVSMLTKARTEAQGIVSQAKKKARGILSEIEKRVVQISDELDQAAQIADRVGMQARAEAARKMKAKIAPHRTAVRSMRGGRNFGER
ncbi:plasmid recombination protein [Celeribacter neptunius]|uniref:plasmid recombination protein n=1 Tax=Celeribacter neptunius TaxID=588602 RepID=UPI0015A68038|nr:plasmid recombination protein [Celeribacter neptunius]